MALKFQNTRVAIIGLGIMVYGTTGHLQAAGDPLNVFVQPQSA
jgi:3-hydroxyisobutyrate dehydrogenase-like beta-hydroxyacid dehydrogenase